jgi:hypothetical protein
MVVKPTKEKCEDQKAYYLSYTYPEEDELFGGESVCDEYGPGLAGPNGFFCVLGEPEDRSWFRDGRAVVDELNRLHEALVELRRRLED